ncbi:lactate utilization protein C [Paenibacillus sp. HJL G12]|uniref:Lactate utilization protein C n=1 Tax=Paenibacillus dendrobii TaxID=2691084 RepID=A0A7X3IHX1_9BACL|nr:lactate utilization protein [Paenibacillus dendrobii]MWV43651.1 lactate utilization protein C [Paenibacillus dendrobii]
MSKSDPEFLSKMSKESQAAEKQFIGNIASRLGRSAISSAPEHPFRGAPEFWTSYELGREEQIARFMSNWEAAGGFTERTASMSDIPAIIVRILEEMNATSTIRQNLPELEQLGLDEKLPELRHYAWDGLDAEGSLRTAEQADAGIVLADFAVAYTGSMIVTSSTEKGRSVSLLPNILIAIISAERMHTRLGEVMSRVAAVPGEQFPAGVHFISGPSRSSDIENDLTIGVHGPGVAFALIVG